ncbi:MULTISPECIES: hypothetical protein [unclassified Thioalkalivibrio]|uniref:hypothetical protein n=1 Tax=unclassified Thioalkalivibrio TaxID=2621013 RepID=UPI0003790E9D|nr:MULTISPECIES: hypothetical protein [unclassified Thioalkalivibrio]
MKKTTIALSLSAALLAAPLTAAAESLSFGEEQTVRAMAGGNVGQAIASMMEAESLAVVNNRSAICGALTGGLGAGMLAANPEAGFSIAGMEGPEDAADAVAAIGDAEVTYLAFGAGASRDDNVALAHALLGELAKAEWDGTLMLHISTWMQQQVQAAAEMDEAVAEYLTGRPMVALMPDVEAGEAVMLRVSFDGSEFTTEEMGRQPMRDDLAELFRRM